MLASQANAAVMQHPWPGVILTCTPEQPGTEALKAYQSKSGHFAGVRSSAQAQDAENRANV